MKRTLRLRRESLAELTPAELGGVAGGQELSLSCPAIRCLPSVRDHCVAIDLSILTNPPTMPQNCNSFPWCSEGAPS